jgi:hypothetical protein
MTMPLTVELVPKGQWGANLRSVLPKADWDRLRKAQYKKAGYVCEVCGGKGPRHPVECHEIWYYDDETNTQRLDGLVALCPTCHAVKHLGRTFAIGQGTRALNHLMRVNEWNQTDAEYYVEAVFEKWSQRSQHTWTLDISWIEQQGVSLPA